jgi:hypothetical protein
MDPYEPRRFYAGPPLVELGRQAGNGTLRHYAVARPTVPELQRLAQDRKARLLPFRWPTPAPSSRPSSAPEGVFIRQGNVPSR